MLRLVPRDCAVIRVGFLAASVANGSFDYALRVIKRRLHAAEATARENRSFRRRGWRVFRPRGGPEPHGGIGAAACQKVAILVLP